MLYYRGKPEKDQSARSDGSILVGRELYTTREKEKYKIPLPCVDPVHVKKTETFWFFGARFAVGDK